MKRLVLGGLLALGLVATATPAWADCYFHSTCCRSMTFVRTCRNRCWNFSSYCNPLPCIANYGGGYSGYAPLAYTPYGYPYAAVAAAPAAARQAAPAPATQPQFKAPQPAPAANNTTGLQQAGYFYYGQTTNPGYGYDAGYNYGAGYGYGYSGYGAYSYAQAPNYWY